MFYPFHMNYCMQTSTVSHSKQQDVGRRKGYPRYGGSVQRADQRIRAEQSPQEH